MGAIFFIFIVELLAFRVGTAKLKKLGIQYGKHPLIDYTCIPRNLTDPFLFSVQDVHGHGVGGHSAHGPEARPPVADTDVVAETSSEDVEKQALGQKLNPPAHAHAHTHASGRERHDHHMDDSALAQILGIAILEFGVMLHRYASFPSFFASR